MLLITYNQFIKLIRRKTPHIAFVQLMGAQFHMEFCLQYVAVHVQCWNMEMILNGAVNHLVL